MRILHVIPTYLPATRYGGPIYSVHGLCKSLVAKGLDVDVLTTNIDGNVESNVELGKPVMVDGVRVYYFPVSLLRRLYYAPRMKEYLVNAIKNYDLIHLHSVFLWPTNMAAAIARQHNIPYVLSPRGMLDKSLIKQKNSLIKNLWIRVIEKNTIQHAAAIHVTSRREKELLQEFSFNLPRILEIPNGIDGPQDWNMDKISPDVRKLIKLQPFILFLGRINWKKGLDLLVNAMKSVPSHVNLLIIGNDDEGYSQEIKRLASVV